MQPVLSKRMFRDGFGSIFARGVGLATTICMAVVFGNDVWVASFWLAHRFFDVAKTIISEGAFRSVIVPQYQALKLNSRSDGLRWAIDLMVLLLLTVGVASIGISLILWWVAGAGHFGLKTQGTLILIAIQCLPIFTSFLGGVGTSVLNSEHHYFFPSFTGFFGAVTWIVGIFLFRHLPGFAAMEGVSWTIVVAAGLILLSRVLPVILIAERELGRKLWTQVHPFSRSVRQSIPFLVFSLISYSLPHFNALFNIILVRFVSLRASAYLAYAWYMQFFFLSVIGYGIISGVQPLLAAALKGDDAKGYVSLINDTYNVTIRWLLPLTIGLIVVAIPFTRLCYGWGAFTMVDVHHTAITLIPYALMLIPRMCVFIQLGILHSHGHGRVQVFVVLVLAICDVILGLVLVIGLDWSFVTVAWINCLTAWVHMAVLQRYIARLNVAMSSALLKSQFLATGLVSIVAALLTVLLYWVIFDGLIFVDDQIELPLAQVVKGVVPVFIFTLCAVIGDRVVCRVRV